MSELGAIFYRGPSLLTGDPIVGIVTGLDFGSHNPKTGAMAQCWVIRPDLPPQEAKRQNLDNAVCGDCKHRGDAGFNSSCYLPVWQAPTNIWKRYRAGGYHDATWPELQALVEGRHLRITGYGDCGAIGYEVWRMLLATVAGWVAYTHTWKYADQRFKAIAMASVDNEDELREASVAGWRTFRVRADDEPLLSTEIVCPASNEAGHRTTCDRCALCRGNHRPARSIAIIAHGHNGALTAFYRNRAAAEAIA
jgi:hypothetical protein